MLVAAAGVTVGLKSTSVEAAMDAPGANGPPPDASEIARGEYLARLGDCSACHSVPGTPDFTGGLPMNSPLGTIYSSNITPDPETGIGKYTLKDFDRALRDGESPSHHLYPAMPYPSFAKVSSDDIRALYAYFMHGVKPVRRTPPRTALPFPFDQRWGMALWNIAFLDKGVYRPDPTRDARWNRGAYLVEGLGHCGSCHTPRGLAYEERGYTQRSSDYLTGGVNDHWFAPNLTGEPTSGLGNWTEAQIATFLKTGHATGVMAFGPMNQVVDESTQYMSDGDLASIATYLKSFAPQARGNPFRPGTHATKTVAWIDSGDVHVPGAGLFNNFCAECHQPDGRGQPSKAPALAGAGVVRAPNADSVIHMILSGGRARQPAGLAAIDPMPPFEDKLDDREIAEVASFVRRSWGNDAPPVTTRDVKSLRDALAAEKKK